jgi:thiamine-phosphate pyrophosphorylase
LHPLSSPILERKRRATLYIPSPIAGFPVILAATKGPAVPYDDLASPFQRLIALQIIDVNVNRASEGLRVVEEYCRFVLSDGKLVARCKSLRDQLHAALDPISRTERLFARDTSSDVGTTIDFESEIRPEAGSFSLQQIAVKNGERVKEALRVIEECCKPLDGDVSRAVGVLRYQWYALEKDCHSRLAGPPALKTAQLYVLVDGGSSECAFAERAAELIHAGVHIIQLRDKTLDDRTLLARARLLRRVIDEPTRTSTELYGGSTLQRPLMVVNDRPDIAVLSRADGVHVGQDELPVPGVRRIMGPEMLVGVSTHTIEQARQAVLDGADYIGCGPTFPSGTKEFDHFPGLDFLRQVAAEISLPAFAIGGITLDNLPQVLSTGIRRVAIGGAVTAADDCAASAKSFLAALGRAP